MRVDSSVIISRLSGHALRRIIAFQGNTSARSPEELDNLPQIDGSDAEPFARSVAALMRASSVRIVGGCCGTGAGHMRAVADRFLQ